MATERIRRTTRRGRAAARERAEEAQYARRMHRNERAKHRRSALYALARSEARRRDRLRSREWAWRREIERRSRAGDLIERVTRVAPHLLSTESLPTLHLLLTVEKRWGWMRPIEEWTPEGRSQRRQRASLIRYLLLDSPVPAFLQPALTRMDDTWTHPAIAIGRGMSLVKHRAALGFPPATRPVIRHFLESTAEWTPWQAYRRAQVLAAGGSEAWADRFARSRLGAATGYEERWAGALAWFVRICDRFPAYLLDRWIAFVTHHFAENPRWSLAGRPPGEVSRQLRNFEAAERRRRAEVAFGTVYSRSSLRGGPVVVTDADGGSTEWWFRQIRTGRDLFFEGERMDHCIFSYHARLLRGEVTVWSLSRTGKPCLTLEVTGEQVEEVRGRFNRTAEATERSVIGQWASRNQLRVGHLAHVD